MTRRRVLVIVLVAIAVMGGAALTVAYDPAARVQGWVRGEPFYAGRSATAWRRDLRDPDELVASQARTALADGKGQAVPVCVWLLQHAEEGPVRWRAAEALGKMGKDAAPAAAELAAALDDPDPLVRGVALRTVRELAPDVPGAVPRLVHRFPDLDAIRTVAKFKDRAAEAVPALIELSRNGADVSIRRESIRALGKIGPPALAALPTLIALAGHDPVAGVREQSAEAIGELGPAAADGIPTLVKALKDPDTKVRRDAVRSLGQMGPAAAAALPDVRALESDPEAIVRIAAKTAAQKISGKE